MIKNIFRATFNISTQKNSLRLPSFSHLHLQPSIMEFLTEKQIHTPTFIQYALMGNLINEPTTQNYHIISPTGTGKTLAYLLPMINDLKNQEIKQQAVLTKSRRPRGLVILPTKELVVQVRSQAKQISHYCKMKVDGINIGRSKIEEDEIIESGLDVLISTFERIEALLSKKLYLSCLDWLIIDEADTFNDSQALKQILSRFSPSLLRRQELKNGKTPKILLSSTTIPPSLQQLVKSSLPNCKTIRDNQTHLNLQNIRHQFLHCQQLDKHQSLIKILKLNKAKTMIFCNTIKSLHQLEYFLQNCGIPVLTLHSELSKPMRLRNYQLFRDGIDTIMLSTDLGARGLDFQDLSRIINYDFPFHTTDYLHRVGRTGRAGRKGYAISLYHKKDLPLIEELRGSSFNHQLKVSNSAYGLKNRQQMRIRKSH